MVCRPAPLFLPMSRPADDITPLLRSVPAFRRAHDLRWQVLGGGSSNQTLKVTADGVPFAVRMPGRREPGDPRLGLHDEWRVLTALAERGAAPEPVWRDEGSGLLVTGFQPGPIWTGERLRNRRHWPALVTLLKCVHAEDIALPDYEPVVAVRRYWAQYLSAATPGPAEQSAWRTFESEQCELERALRPSATCHNDVMSTNLVGDPPVLLDWEYAARSDPLFDLATIVVGHGLDARMGDELLALYLGGDASPVRRRFTKLCRLCLYVCAFWALAKHGRLPAPEVGLVTLPNSGL